MSGRSAQLANALVRCQGRVQACERALARFVSRGKDGQPKLTGQHVKLLQALDDARQDMHAIERMLRSESERGFDLLAMKMGAA